MCVCLKNNQEINPAFAGNSVKTAKSSPVALSDLTFLETKRHLADHKVATRFRAKQKKSEERSPVH